MRLFWKALDSDSFGTIVALAVIFGPFIGLSIAEFPEGGLRDVLLRATWVIVPSIIGLALLVVGRDELRRRHRRDGSIRRPGSNP